LPVALIGNCPVGICPVSLKNACF